jgi:hypothetical protein
MKWLNRGVWYRNRLFWTLMPSWAKDKWSKNYIKTLSNTGLIVHYEYKRHIIVTNHFGEVLTCALADCFVMSFDEASHIDYTLELWLKWKNEKEVINE